MNSLQRNYGDDGRSEVILDAGGNVYVASSPIIDFPGTAGFFQSTFGGGIQDGVVLKLTPDLSNILFASYIVGSGNDAAYVLSINPTNNNIYVAGGTESQNLLQGTQGGTLGTANHGVIDGFVAIINNTGTAVLRSTYIGTAGIDQVFGVQFDALGFPYIMGQTTGAWPIQNATFSNAGGKQFICKGFATGFIRLCLFHGIWFRWSDAGNISPIAFLVDRCENVYISGWGAVSSVQTMRLIVQVPPVYRLRPMLSKAPRMERIFISLCLKKNAASQLFGSFFGENNAPGTGCDHVDGGTSRFDRNGKIYQAICGNCNIGTRPIYPTTPGSWSTVNNAVGGGECNLTMLKIDMNLAGVRAGIQSTVNGVPRDTAGCQPLTVDFSDTLATGVSYEWYFGDGSPMVATTVPNASHTYLNIGTYNVMLVAIDPATCNVRDTSYTVKIRVGNLLATPAFVPVKLPPCGSFNYRFDNTTIAPPTRPFTNQSFVWDFGDGTPTVTAGTAPVFHTYAGPGTYNVKLLLQDTVYCNAPDSLVIPLSVADNVKAQFTTPASGCLLYTPVFDNTSLAAQTFLWNFWRWKYINSCESHILIRCLVHIPLPWWPIILIPVTLPIQPGLQYRSMERLPLILVFHL